MSTPTTEAGLTPGPSSQVQWTDAARQAHFEHWLNTLAMAHGLHLPSLQVASADASFRRYFRIHTDGASLIVVDAPPAHENCEAFVKVAGLMLAAGLNSKLRFSVRGKDGAALLTEMEALFARKFDES